MLLQLDKGRTMQSRGKKGGRAMGGKCDSVGLRAGGMVTSYRNL
jgi:hypothetical protein